MSDDARGLPPTTPPSSRPATTPASGACSEGVPPEDVAAWALDGADYPKVDLSEHVPTCPACRGVVGSLERVSAVGRTLRGAGDAGPPATVIEQALGRVRVERTATLLLGTVGEAFLRVAAALPDLAVRGSEEDTAELPRVRPPASDA
jgi:hypothetical protein